MRIAGFGDNLTGEVGMVAVDAGVEHGDGLAGAVIAGGPGGISADVGHAVGQVEGNGDVFLDAGDARGFREQL